ncbi:uncharacterized protein G2W53_041908 [Senna tora]|uniref:Uncharacterized protein n=1 Tax=Senna tora TaxID=362788 RepID=A0A834SG30_9FABA|nr:uncharacterized protein G2W53_041908 [Senna tora]
MIRWNAPGCPNDRYKLNLLRTMAGMVLSISSWLRTHESLATQRRRIGYLSYELVSSWWTRKRPLCDWIL